MPELPDLTLYLEAIEQRFKGTPLQRTRVASPFVVRSHDPPISALHGKTLTGTRRVGKRLVLEFEDDLFLVIHLMIAGRLRLKKQGIAVPRRLGLLALDFESHTILMTEASKKKRASVHVVRGEQALTEHDPGGIEPLGATLKQFTDVLLSEQHTLKRTLTDPRVFAGIGNAYSDEILHRAKLSPVTWTTRLGKDDIKRLHTCTKQVLKEWTRLLRDKGGGEFPDKVTAFHDEMAAHGKYGKPCPVCETPIQRIRRAENEVNYCPECQTGGKLLADRGLSRLLKGDWPKTLEELDEMKASRRQAREP